MIITPRVLIKMKICAQVYKRLKCLVLQGFVHISSHINLNESNTRTDHKDSDTVCGYSKMRLIYRASIHLTDMEACAVLAIGTDGNKKAP